MDLPIILACIFGSVGAVLFLLYKYLTRTFGYWEAMSVPAVKPKLIYGTLDEYDKKPAEEVERTRYEKYGRVYGTYELSQRAINIADPELVQRILVKDFHVFTNRRTLNAGLPVLESMLSTTRDETWKRIRTVISPSFTSGKLKKMNSLLVDATNGLVDNFLAAANTQELVDLKMCFLFFTLDLIGLCAFGITIDSSKNPDHPFVVNAKKILSPKIPKMALPFFLIPGAVKLVRPFAMHWMGLDYFTEACEDIIKKRRDQIQTSKKMDFMQLMLDAREEEDKDEKEDHFEHFYRENESSTPIPAWNITKSLSDLEILAQSILFLIAGQETTSTALSFVAYELAMNPDIQDKVYEEIRDVYQKHGTLNYEVVGKMTYLDAVVSETLRLHTVLFKLEREASEDYVLGSNGVVVPKGTLVNILPYALHHDPEWYPDPYKFDPDRFLPCNRPSIKPYTYLPFGDGPRNCVAMRFALLSMKLCLAMVIQKIHFVATKETKAPIDYLESAAFLIPKAINVRLEKRN